MQKLTIRKTDRVDTLNSIIIFFSISQQSFHCLVTVDESTADLKVSEKSVKICNIDSHRIDNFRPDPQIQFLSLKTPSAAICKRFSFFQVLTASCMEKATIILSIIV